MSKETAQHTPGPWRADGLNILASYDTDDGNRHHCHVADVTNRNAINRAPSMEECANAALIASAPTLKAEVERLTALNAELVAALGSIVSEQSYQTPAGTENCRFCDCNLDDLGTGEDMHDKDCMITKARAALQKAQP